MTVSTSIQIPRTSDPMAFQRQCKVLFEKILGDPNVQEFGTSGQAQHGIDLLGRRLEKGLLHWVGIQCKLTGKPKLRHSTVRSEAAKALEFQPPLMEFIIATTAEDSADLQTEAALVTDEQARLGRDFLVQVWGWKTLQTHILQHESAINAFCADAFPQVNRLVAGQEKLLEEVAKESTQLQILQMVRRLPEAITLVGAGPHSDFSAAPIDTFLDRRVDEYRQLLNEGKPATAIRLLQALLDELSAEAEGRIGFRLRSLIAACTWRLGNQEAAARLYLEATAEAPNEPRAPALKVLGHILLGQIDDALAVGRSALRTGAEQAPLVANLIAACKHRGDDNDPAEFLDADLLADAAVAISYADFLRAYPSRGSWKEVSRDALERHPDDDTLKRFNAEADLDDACVWANEHGRSDITGALRHRVEQATDVLQTLWERSLSSEEAWDDLKLSLAANAINGHRLLGRREAAAVVAGQALERAPEDSLLLELRFIAALESSDLPTATALLSRVPETRNVVLGKVQLFASRGDWLSIRTLGSHVNDHDFDVADRAFLEAVMLLARVKSRGESDPVAAGTTLLDRYPDKVAVPIVLYDIAREIGEDSWARALFGLALAQQASLDSASRVMLARIAESERNFGVVVDLLYGYVDQDEDSAELRTLSRAFANGPPRSEALPFLEGIRDQSERNSFYARVIGCINFNRGALPDAIESFRTALKHDPNQVASHLGLVDSLLRQDLRGDVAAHLAAVDVEALVGSPDHLLRLARLLVLFGRADDGFRLGYSTALHHKGDVRVAQEYVGLVLMDSRDEFVPITTDEVGVNHWVQLARTDGRRLEVVIEEGTDRPGLDHYSPRHGLAQLLLGKKQGESVVVRPPMGSSEAWEIKEIKHKYVALLHEFMETIPTRFPDVEGFHRFTTVEGDVAPILAQVKRLSERDETVRDLYTREYFPLGLVGRLLGKNTIEVAGHTVYRGGTIRTCIGTLPERNAALQRIKESRNSGVVLDSFSAWTAFQLGVTGDLAALFDQVAIPQSVIDELLEWRGRFEYRPNQPLMTIGYADGGFFREEMSPEQLAEAARGISEGIAILKGAFSVCAADPPGRARPGEETVLEVGGGSFFDPLYVSIGRDLLLVSDDMHYRDLCRELHGREGAWLQPILMACREEGLMDLERYARSVSDLALLKHGHVALSADVLVSITNLEDPEDVRRLSASAAFIGNEDADFQSHYMVALSYFHSIWSSDGSRRCQCRASSLMLDRLVPMLARTGELELAFRRLLSDSRSAGFVEYAKGWARGHFLPFALKL